MAQTHHLEREHRQFQSTSHHMWLSGVWSRGYLDWIYSLTFLQPTRVPKMPIFHRDGAKVFRLFGWNTEKILYCFFIKKASGGALLFTSVWRENLNHMFLLKQPLFECTRDLLFPTRLLNDSSSCAPSNHKTSEALSTQKTGWSSSLPLLPPQVLPCYQVTSAERHTPGLYCSPSIKTPHKTRPHRSSASSLDEWKLLKLL